MTVTLLLSADLFEGPPIADITVDGVALPSVPVLAPRGGKPQRVDLSLAPGLRAITLGFNNDAWGGAADRDRNLYLDGVLIGGVDAGVPPHAFLARGDLTFAITVPVVAAPLVTAVAPLALLSIRAAVGAVLDDIDALIRAVPTVAPPPAPPLPVAQSPVVPPPVPAGPGTTIVVGPAEWGGKTVVNGMMFSPATVVMRPGEYRSSAVVGIGAMPDRYDTPFERLTLRAETMAWPPNVCFVGGDRQWGKATLVACGGLQDGGIDATVTLEGISVRDVLKGQSDGTAGIYVDKHAHLVMRGCEASNNNNGVFASPFARSVLIEDSLFVGNGCDGGDGASHHLYLESDTTTVRRTVFGPLRYPGNVTKIRSRGRTHFDRCMFFSNDGRFVDRPDGGETLVENSILVQLPNATSNQMFAYGEEVGYYDGKPTNGHYIDGDPATGVFVYRNCDIWLQADAAIMAAQGIIRFKVCRWHFVRALPGRPPTVLAIQKSGLTERLGTVEGLPFAIVTDRNGGMTMPIPDSAWEAGPAPAMPTSPFDLPAVLARHLPKPIPG